MRAVFTLVWKILTSSSVSAMKQYVEPRTLQKLLAETDELVKIFHASVKTARKNLALSEE